MNNTLELSGNQTSLKNQKPFGLDVLLISTSLMLFNGVDQSEVNRKLIERHRLRYFGGSLPSGNGINLNSGITSYGTTIDLCFPTFTFTNTTLVSNEGESDDDFTVKPSFKEFRIRVSSLKIRKSLPKIFAE